MVEMECGLLGLLVFVAGLGAGAVLTYIPFSFQVAKLQRKLKRLQS
jgi:cell division protein FtsB